MISFRSALLFSGLFLTFFQLSGQASFPEASENPVWVVDNKNFGQDNCYVYQTGESMWVADTLWTEVVRLFHPTACLHLDYDTLLLADNATTVGYFTVFQDQVWGKKALNAASFLLYDFALLDEESTTVLFSLLSASGFNPDLHLRTVTVATKASISLPEGETTQLILTPDSSPFPPYFIDGATYDESWIRTVGSTAQPFSAFECVAYGCENSFRLNTLYVDDGSIRYQFERPNAVDQALGLGIKVHTIGRQIQLQQETANQLHLSVLTVQGQRLQSFQTFQLNEVFQLPTHWPRGIYLLHIESPQGELTKRIWVP